MGSPLKAEFSKGFATRVFSRIGELGLHQVGKNGKPGAAIQTADDLALELIRQQYVAGRDEFFKLMLAYQLGKPVQPTIMADTRETAPELDFGNLIMPAADAKPGTAGKPN